MREGREEEYGIVSLSALPPLLQPSPSSLVSLFSLPLSHLPLVSLLFLLLLSPLPSGAYFLQFLAYKVIIGSLRAS